MHLLFRTLIGPALAFGLVAAVPAAAQVQGMFQPVTPQGAVMADARAELSRNLTLLANNPNSVAALTGAGRAALELDDPEAALTFFGRAEELEPQNGPIKANLGTALVLLDQAEPALRFLEEAVRLGVAEAEIAGSRGLAFDLTGNPQRAQRDYQTSLRRREDPEIRRRLALSLAISGQRNAAIAAIDDQLRRQDRAAWRTRAFVLALTGDVQGANEAVRAAVPGQAEAMAPFLAKLPTLNSADRARAVHLGHFPGEHAPRPALALAPAPPPAPAPAPPAAAPVASNPLTSAGRPDPNQRPLGLLPPPASITPSGFASTAPLQVPAPPGVTAQPSSAPVPPVAAVPVSPAPEPPKPQARTSGLSGIAAVVAELRDPPATGTPKPKAAKAAPEKAPPAKPAPAKTAAAPKPPKEPSRSWVQLAHGSTAASLDGSFPRIKAKAPKLFAGKDAWIATQRSTARLLVGPFKSSKEAQDFADRLEKEEVKALAWTSPAGQEVRKIAAR